MFDLRINSIYICISFWLLIFIACRKERLVVLQRIKPRTENVTQPQSNPTPNIPIIIGDLPVVSPFKTPERKVCTPCLTAGKKYIVTIQSTHDPISTIGLRIASGSDGKQVKEYAWGVGRTGLPIEQLKGEFNESKTKWVSPPLEFKAINAYMRSFPSPLSPSYRNDVMIEITDEQGKVIYHSSANLMAHPPNWREGNIKEGLSLSMVGSICKDGNTQSGCRNKGRYPENGRYKVRVKANGGTIQRLFIFKENKNGDADYESFDVYQKTNFETPEFEVDDQILELSLTAASKNGNITVELIKNEKVIETVTGSGIFIKLEGNQISKTNNGTGVWPPSGFWTTYL